jgi:glyoxylase-like metal-dependent hydrolase (beta-lactamase superfamily II)
MTGLNESWYSVKEAAKKVWQIDDNGEDTIYLVEGNDKALLIDTGWGIADLSKLISAITPLPVVAVNTHCHPDHVCGNHQFDRIYIHRNDAAMMKGNFTGSAVMAAG